MTDQNIAPLTKGDPDEPFWSAWRERQSFMLHRCRACGRSEWPATCCIDHGLAQMEWVEASGAGIIDTYTVFHRAYSKELALDVPYNVTVVRLDEGPYFHTRIIDTPPEKLKTGMRVIVDRNAEAPFPFFRPSE